MTGVNGPLESFACPVCGRLRTLGPQARTNLATGRSSGECPPGSGCRSRLELAEVFRRFWLHSAGVSPREVRAAGSAEAYVAANGLPEWLHALADVLPPDLTLDPQAARAAASGRRRLAA